MLLLSKNLHRLHKTCYRLHVYVPPKFICWNPNPNVMVLRGGILISVLFLPWPILCKMLIFSSFIDVWLTKEHCTYLRWKKKVPSLLSLLSFIFHFMRLMHLKLFTRLWVSVPLSPFFFSLQPGTNSGCKLGEMWFNSFVSILFNIHYLLPNDRKLSFHIYCPIVTYKMESGSWKDSSYSS